MGRGGDALKWTLPLVTGLQAPLFILVAVVPVARGTDAPVRGLTGIENQVLATSLSSCIRMKHAYLYRCLLLLAALAAAGL